VGDLESLKAVTALSFLSDDIEDGVNELGSLGVVTLAQLLPAPVCPKTKLSGLKSCPNGPALTESMVPGSRSIRMALGT